MNINNSSPFHYFQGAKFWALFVIFIVYTLWFVGPGYFGQMMNIPGHVSLQDSGFYSGATAVEILGRLNAAGQKTKYLALIFDVPYMIMQALVFEALIAFGLRHLNPQNPKWNLLFILPMAFLLADFAEDSFIGLTLASGSETLGTMAGIMTALKFTTFIPTICLSIIMSLAGLTAWKIKKHLSD